MDEVRLVDRDDVESIGLSSIGSVAFFAS